VNQDHGNCSEGETDAPHATATKEVALYRSQYAKRPEVFAADLASSLIELGLRFVELGRLEEARRAT
jgi:hypothetical protein